MLTRLLAAAVLLATFDVCALAQSAATNEQRAPQPLYKVTIVSRTTKALNYGYLSAPTRIGFQGTPVAPSAKGKGTVEPKRGATLLRLSFENLPAPTRFGAQYLTYVVWGISPDGRPQNLGELILDGSDEAKLNTSTPLQTFALIVTAEPYYTVAQPSGVVVLENVVTRETVGKVQEVNATYELLPRQSYTYDMAAPQTASGDRQVSNKEYESLAALYQALNAIQIAQSQGADRYAPDQISRARDLYNKARGYPMHLSKEIVSLAREATQIAEDSRAIALKRAASENAETPKASESTKAAESKSVTEAGSQVARPQGDRSVRPPRNTDSIPELESRTQPISGSESGAEPAAPIVVDHSQFMRDDPNASENRRRLLASLPQDFEVIDSSKGVTITLPPETASSSLARYYFPAVASAVKRYRGLHLNVEAHSDNPDSLAETQRDAMRVKGALVNAGIPPDVIVARGFGDTRPRGSNGTASGRAQNRRVEIIIAGDPIGTLASWDRRYTVEPRQARR